jgi:hypothetical protein
MNQESRKKGKGGTRCLQRVITGPSHRLGDKPIHLPIFLIDL